MGNQKKDVKSQIYLRDGDLLKKVDASDVDNAVDTVYTDLKANQALHLMEQPDLEYRIRLIGSIIGASTSYGQVSKLLSPMLMYLSHSQSETVQTLVVVNFIRLQQKYNQVTEAVVSFLEDLVLTDDRKLLFHVMAKLFVVCTAEMSLLFVSSAQLAKILGDELSSILSKASLGAEWIATQALGLLNLFSAACIDERARSVIAEKYLSILVRALDIKADSTNTRRVRVLSGVVLSKILNLVKPEQLKENPELTDLPKLCGALTVAVSDKELRKDALEGLAYLSLKNEVKRHLRRSKFSDELLKLMETEDLDPSLRYGTLVVISNLTAYRPVMSKEQESFKALKDYAQATRQQKEEYSESDNAEIAAIVNDWLEKKALGTAVGHATKTSNGYQLELVKLVSNFSQSIIFRSRVVQQGGLNYLINWLANNSDAVDYSNSVIRAKETVSNAEVRLVALRTIAKLLITNNPNNAFNKYEPTIVIPFLTEVLQKYDMDTNGTDYKLAIPLATVTVTPLDVFETLLSLTNLASMDKPAIWKVGTRFAWKYLQNLMLDQDARIQCAALELISNLVVEPECSQHFFDWSNPENKKNFDVLCQLIDLSSVKSQLAVMGIFANVSDFEMIAQILARTNSFLEKAIQVLEQQPQEEDLVLRCIYTLINCSYVDTTFLKQYDKLNETIGAVIRCHSTNKDTVQMCLQLVKLVKSS